MKKIKIVLIVVAAIILIFALYRALFIRIVNYDIGGVKIPSYYNLLTGKAKPISDYHGTRELPTIESRKMDKTGLSEKQAMGAQLRWSVFEKWLMTKPEYKGWESNPALFAKAQQDFKKNIEPHMKAVVIK